MFWAILIAMLLVAIVVLVLPLLKVRDESILAYKESNLKINDEKISELDLDLAEGRIDQTFYKSARQELDRELLIDIPEENQQTAAEHYTNVAKRHPAWALLITVFVPMLALLVYLELGMHAASEDTFLAEQKVEQRRESGQQSVEEMAQKLEKHIEKNGGSVEEWVMLARSHKYMKKYGLAAKAFAVALEKDENDAQLMLERAEMLALDNNRAFNAEARNLVLAAYKLEPDNANVLWFVGVAEFQNENHQQAINHLTKLLPLARGDENVVKSIISIVSKSREKLIAEGKEMPELVDLLGVKALAPEKSVVVREDTAGANSVSTPVTQLQVAVDVAESVKQKFNANDAVFIYAKAKQGPRMPLAAQRVTLADLPVTITLDDSMTMVDGMSISAFDQLVVSARVTKSGSAIAKSGDYIGQAELEVKNKGTVTKLNLVIDTMIP